jgi:hypothetical protein
MSRTALEDTRYEDIKAYALDPETSALSAEKKYLLDRVISASKILDKNPIQKQAVALHQQKYPDISRRQAYEDLRFAVKMFNTLHTFDYDFYHTWLINDIIKNIESCRNAKSVKDRDVIAKEHANLIKAIGPKPEDLPDPKRNEKHEFYILIQNDNRQVKVDLNKLKDLPPAALQELNKAIYGGNEITDIDAEEIMNS